ncbi:hypothetical protein GXW82_31430 [Streptacidiphilus sp. 4-A2]|nr:hypothetical protein [Streptacidiphilus sp. 4-A2]
MTTISMHDISATVEETLVGTPEEQADAARLLLDRISEAENLGALIGTLLDDEDQLRKVAGRSYIHPNGFDKITLATAASAGSCGSTSGGRAARNTSRTSTTTAGTSPPGCSPGALRRTSTRWTRTASRCTGTSICPAPRTGLSDAPDRQVRRQKTFSGPSTKAPATPSKARRCTASAATARPSAPR